MIINVNQERIHLYVKGSFLPKDKKAIAIVGSRVASEKGKGLAYKYAFDLAKRRITIVSGMAYGIDSVAHKGALDAGGRTIAVLGSGLNVIYPPENKDLAREIVKSGALVSEFPPNTQPYPKNFLARNRIVTGLSKAVLIIEGAKRSGTLSTASWAADQGKEVFVIPGSPATDFLIENGASIPKSPQDIINYLNLSY